MKMFESYNSAFGIWYFSHMDLSIVAVSWNVRERLRECLTSLESIDYRLRSAILKTEIFVVDNASHDGSADMVAREFPHVTLIANKYNAGFAKANNQAITRAQGEFILLLNSDTHVFPDTLSRMVAFMGAHPDVGVAGCHLVDDNGRTVPHIRRFPTFLDQAAIVLKIPHLFPQVTNRYEMRDFDYSKEEEVDSVRGSFFMIRRKVIEQIGALDESFFIWFEEVDFCKRARAAGWKIMYTPAAQCVDYVGQSFKQMRIYPKQKMFTRSMIRYFRKHRPWYEWLGLALLRPFGLTAAWSADAFPSLKRRG